MERDPYSKCQFMEVKPLVQEGKVVPHIEFRCGGSPPTRVGIRINPVGPPPSLGAPPTGPVEFFLLCGVHQQEFSSRIVQPPS